MQSGKFILNQEPCKVEFRIRGKGEKIQMMAFDALIPENEYIDREIGGFENEQLFFIPLPIAPEVLTWGIDGECELLSEPIIRLNTQKPIFEKKATDYNIYEQEFINFAFDFCRKAGHLPEGHYQSANKNFTIEYVDRVRNQEKQVLNTAARVNRLWSRIYVSRTYFQKITVPAQIFILFHEFTHHYLLTEDEFLADEVALYFYLTLGFSKYEGITCLAKMFAKDDPKDDVPEQLNRYQRLLGLIRNYNF